MDITGKEHAVCALVVVVVFLTIPVSAVLDYPGPQIKTCGSTIPHDESGHIDCSSPNGVSFFQGSMLIANCSSGNNGSCTLANDVNHYIVTSAPTVGKYFLTIPAMNGSYCGTYRCTDSIEEDSVKISYTDTNIATLNNSEEPEQHKDGIVEFSTSCLLSIQNLTKVYARVWQQRGPEQVEVFHNMHGVSVNIENSTCTETCNEEYTSKIVARFVHNTARTENTLQGKYVVKVTIPDRNISWEASTIRSDYIFPGEDNEKDPTIPLWAIVACVCVVAFVIVLVIAISCYCLRRKKNKNNRYSSSFKRGPSLPTVSNGRQQVT